MTYSWWKILKEIIPTESALDEDFECVDDDDDLLVDVEAGRCAEEAVGGRANVFVKEEIECGGGKPTTPFPNGMFNAAVGYGPRMESPIPANPPL